MKYYILTLSAFAVALVSGTSQASAHDAQQCREFTRNIIIDNKVVEGVGTACLQNDGSWQIVSSDHAHANDHVAETVIFRDAPIRERVVVLPARNGRYTYNNRRGHNSRYVSYSPRNSKYYARRNGNRFFGVSNRRGHNYY